MNHDPLIKAIRNNEYSEQTPSLVFADHLEENNIPGAHIVRAAAGNRSGTGTYPFSGRTPAYFRAWPTGRLAAIRIAGPNSSYPIDPPVVAQVSHRTDRDDYPSGQMDSEGWESVGPLRVGHTAPVYHKGDLEHFIQDFPVEHQEAIRKQFAPLLPDAPVKNNAVGNKIAKIEHEGIRGKPVSHKQAVAVAINMNKAHKLARPHEAESEQMLKAIHANPEESTGWLAYADWLDEHGHDVPAARIRWWEGAKQYLREHPETHEEVRRTANPYRDIAPAYAVLDPWVGRLTAIHAARTLMENQPPLPTDELRNEGLKIGEEHAFGIHDEKERRRVNRAAEDARRDANTAGTANHMSAAVADMATQRIQPNHTAWNDLLARFAAHMRNRDEENVHHSQYDDRYRHVASAAYHVRDYAAKNPPPKEEISPTKLARVQAPAGGMVVNNQYSEGGQFVAKAFQRIRDVVRRRWKLARPKAAEHTPDWVTEQTPLYDDRVAASPEDNPHRPLMSAPSILAGEQPGPEGRLTYGQLKRIEDLHGMPPEERLSTKIKSTGDNDTFNAPIERIAQFFHHLGKRRLSDHALRTILRDPNQQPEEKIVHLVSHLGHELADFRGATKSNGNEWYGEKVNHLDRVLHNIFASGPSDPMWGTLNARGELEGKHDPATHHPAMVLFKALIAGTSAGQNPVKNLLSAYRIWQHGRRANPEDPITGAPLVQHEYLSQWMKKLSQVNGSPVPPPPSDWPGKAAWYAKYVYPYKGQLAAKDGDVGYSSVPAVVNVVPTDYTHPHHGLLVKVQESGRWVNNRKLPRTLEGKQVLADLPRTNVDGSVKAKAWAKISPEPQIKKLKALVSYFSGPNKSVLESYRDAARWLLSDHSNEEIDRVSKATGGKVPNAAKHRSQSFLRSTDLVPGSFMFGPKFGPFMLNLHMNDPATREKFGQHLTADKWWTRLWNRYTGRLFDTNKKNPAATDIREAPAGITERRAMADAAKRAAAHAGVKTVAELQADLWYYEQALWRMFGGERMDSYDFAHAADAVKQRHEEDPTRLARDSKLPPPTVWVKCPMCNGTKLVEGGKYQCDLCSGTGRTTAARRTMF